MPIDEAEGIGSNYYTLHSLAVKYGYQVVSMSINSVTGIAAGEQTVYTLVANLDPYAGVNSDPFPMVGYYHHYMSLFFPQGEL